MKIIMNKKLTAVLFALLAAVFYAINIPFSKLLLEKIFPTFMASFLYFGAALGIGAVYLFSPKKPKHAQAQLQKHLLHH